jgi:hypothetical protein
LLTDGGWKPGSNAEWDEERALKAILGSAANAETGEDDPDWEYRFKAIEDDTKRSEFRDKLQEYVNRYSFISQIAT